MTNNTAIERKEESQKTSQVSVLQKTAFIAIDSQEFLWWGEEWVLMGGCHEEFNLASSIRWWHNLSLSIVRWGPRR